MDLSHSTPVATLEDAVQYLDNGISIIKHRLRERVQQRFVNLRSRYVDLEGYLLTSKYLRERGALLSYALMTNFKPIHRKLYRSCVDGGLIHAASVIHDDVEDRAKFRRGYRTPNTVLGEEAAVFIGDELIADEVRTSFDSAVSKMKKLARGGKKSSHFLDAYSSLRSSQILYVAMDYMAKGQTEERLLHRDLRGNVFGEAPLPPRAVEEISQRLISFTYNKTGSLIRAFFELGVFYGGVDWSDNKEFPGLYGEEPKKRVARELLKIVEKVGFDFQRRDDILDAVGDFQKTGKEPGMDIRNGLINTVHLAVFESPSPLHEQLQLPVPSQEEKNLLYAILCKKRKTEEHVLQANTIAIRYGVPVIEHRLEQRLQDYSQSIDQLHTLGVCEIGCELFRGLAQAMVKREI
ncbi:MAG: polyprenyl synthetase family protein [Nanoarchaeota archaeon]